MDVDNVSCAGRVPVPPRIRCAPAPRVLTGNEVVLVVVTLAFTAWLLVVGHALPVAAGVALLVVVVLVPRGRLAGLRGLALRLAGPVVDSAAERRE